MISALRQRVAIKLPLHLLGLQCLRSLTEVSVHPLRLGGDTFPLKIGRERKKSKLAKTQTFSDAVNSIQSKASSL